MMVITSVSDRPVTEPAGTIGAFVRFRAVRRVRASPASRSARGACPVLARPRGEPVAGPSYRAVGGAVWPDPSGGRPVGLSNNPDMAVVQLQTRRLGLAHQLVVVGGDQHR